jgi:predicted TPR repeat methyltransferase
MSDENISDNEAIDAALQLDGDPQNVNAFYEDWARDYNLDVASAGYSGPEISARLLRRFRSSTDIDLLDAGCGTGLVGIELVRLGYERIDGFDLSESMADQARESGCYRQLIGGVDIVRAEEHYPKSSYDAVLSVGVFTLGHVPPEALPVLLRLTRPGGLLVISTRTQYYDRSGFRQLLDRLLAAAELELLQRLENAPYNKDGEAHYFVMRKPA